MSDPSTMLKGIGNWNGPQGMSWPSDGTLVFSVYLFLIKNDKNCIVTLKVAYRF